MTTLRTPEYGGQPPLRFGGNEYASFPVLFMKYWNTGPSNVDSDYYPLWKRHWLGRLPEFFSKTKPQGYPFPVDWFTNPFSSVFPCTAENGFEQKLQDWRDMSGPISRLIGPTQGNSNSLTDLHGKLGTLLQKLVAEEKTLEQLKRSDVNAPNSVLSSMPLRNDVIYIQKLISNLILSLQELPDKAKRLPDLSWERASLEMRRSINRVIDAARSSGATEYDVTPARNYVDVLALAEETFYSQRYAQLLSVAFGQLQTALEGIRASLAKLQMCMEDLYIGVKFEMSPEAFEATKKELLQPLPEIIVLLKGLENTSGGFGKMRW